MGQFQKLQILKDKMLEPELKKRRHLGCEFCGKTFYGYLLQKFKGKYSLYNDYNDYLYYPECNSCQLAIGVWDATIAKDKYQRMLKKEEANKKRAEAKHQKFLNTPVIYREKLIFKNKLVADERVEYLSKNPQEINKYEMMSNWFLDRIFWKIFGKGCHELKVRNFIIKKELWNGTYMSNSGKTRMGSFTPYFEVTNNQTGKVREIGTDSVKRAIEREERFGTNRRNDPDRNWGLGRD